MIFQPANINNFNEKKYLLKEKMQFFYFTDKNAVFLKKNALLCRLKRKIKRIKKIKR
jgi:hypothetical protein